jgi:hypothetical protein
VPADGSVVNGYLTDRPTLQKLQQLSVALLGVRNTAYIQCDRKPAATAGSRQWFDR